MIAIEQKNSNKMQVVCVHEIRIEHTKRVKRALTLFKAQKTPNQNCCTKNYLIALVTKSTASHNLTGKKQLLHLPVHLFHTKRTTKLQINSPSLQGNRAILYRLIVVVVDVKIASILEMLSLIVLQCKGLFLTV